MKNLHILYENEEIIIVDKPTGLAVQGGEGIVHPLTEILSVQTGIKIYPVHRLDRDTAGILVTAKNSSSAAKWTKIISEGNVKKEYVAICIDSPKTQAGTISIQLDKKGVSKDAITHFKVLEKIVVDLQKFPQQETVVSSFSNIIDTHSLTFSLVSFTLDTGRMHQIRIHSAKSGFPIIADDKYGNFKMNKLVKKLFGAKNLQLCATSLCVPIENTNRVFTIRLPQHMDCLLENIKKYQKDEI